MDVPVSIRCLRRGCISHTISLLCAGAWNDRAYDRIFFREAFPRRIYVRDTQSVQGEKMRGGSIVGALPAIGLAGIFVFYNIVIGWILKYLVMSVSGELGKINADTYFDGFAGTASSIPWDILSIMLTILIISFGVTKGIERISKIIMPALFVIFLLLAVRSLTLPGAMDGVRFLMKPDWSQLGKVDTWVMALGQAFLQCRSMAVEWLSTEAI